MEKPVVPAWSDGAKGADAAMVRLTDPGAGLPREQAREARLKEWKRPTKKAEREALRAERILAAREAVMRGADVRK